MLFLPNGEWHELTLLFPAVSAKKHEITGNLSGASVPLQEVLTVAETLRPDFSTHHYFGSNGYSPDEYLNTIAGKFPDATVYASGTQFINTITL